MLRCGTLLVLVWLVCAGRAGAQLPATRLDGVFPAGRNPGASFELTISGADLDDVDRLHFSHAGITVEQKMAEPGPFDEGPQPVPNTFNVTIGGDVPVGLYEVRAQGKYGMSNPRSFDVNTLAETLETEPNNNADEAGAITTPTVLNGQINGATDVDWFQVAVTANERVLFRCETRRIDSLLDSVVTVFGADGRQLAESRDGYDYDPLIDLTATQDETWLVRVTDSQYRGGPNYVYRMTVGAVPHVDFAFPPAGPAGTTAKFTLYGRNLPGGKPSEFSVEGRPLEQLDIEAALPQLGEMRPAEGVRIDADQAGLTAISYRLDAGGILANPILLCSAAATAVTEAADNNDTPETAQVLTVPCEVAGRLYPQRDRDWYSFMATQGQRFTIEVLSHRLGLSTNPSLVIQQVTTNDAGEEQVRLLANLNDPGTPDGGHRFDNRTYDPVYEFTAPADATYRLLVQDGYSALRNDPRLIYQLSVHGKHPDFSVVAVPGSDSGGLLLRKGGRDTLRVVVLRRDGFDGEVRVAAEGLPEGVTSSEIIIPGANSGGTLILTTAEDAPAAIAQIRVTAKAMLNGEEVTRVARAGTALAPSQVAQPNQQLPSVPARLTESVLVTVSEGETSPVLLTAGDDKVWETARGGILKIPYSLVRRNDYKGTISGFSIDLPPNVNAPNFNIGGNDTSGELEIRLTANTPPGTSTFFAYGFAQQYQYRRNPEAAEAAEAERQRFDQIQKDTQEKSRTATDEANKAKQALDQANSTLTAATNTRTAAEKSANDAQAEAERTGQAAEAARKSAEESQDNAELQTAAANAEKAAADAAAAATKAADEFAAADKAFKDAQTAQQSAQDAKTAADKAAQEAAALFQQAQQAKRQADQRAQQLKNAANPRNVNLLVPSNPITISIAEFPITLEGPPESATLKQGEMLEIPLKITRLYDFDANVNMQLRLPGGVGGIGIQNVNIGNGQTEGKITVTAQANATPGTHTLTLQAQMNFNGQNLTMERPLALTIEAVEAQK
jgi:hypothetical protein